MPLTRREILMAYKEGKLSTSEVQQRLRDLSTRSPLSLGQQGLWMLQKTYPEMSAYNVPVCLRIRVALNPELFEEALRFVLTRFPILRTVIGEENGVPWQSITATQPPVCEYMSVASLDSDDVVNQLREKVKRPFVLETGPLMRVCLASGSPEDHMILIVLHHIIFDGASTLSLVNTLLGAYRDLVEGRKPSPVSSRTGYVDFVEWERAMLSSKKAETYRSYWKQKLSGTLPVLELPVDYPRSGARKFQGKTYSCQVSAELSTVLKQFAKAQYLNVSALFLTVFKVMLHKYSGQEDILVGMPTRGRPHDSFESLIGYFINMIPLRSRVEGTGTFLQLVRDVQLCMMDGLDHAAYPFPLIVRDVTIPRCADSDLLQASFMYQNFFSPGSFLEFEELQKTLSLEFVNSINQEGEFELVLEVYEREQDFLVNIKFNPELYAESAIQSMMQRYLTLAERSVRNPDTRIAELSFTSEAEEKTVLIEWNATQRYYPDECMHELFQEQALIAPEAIAVVHEGTSLSYRELDEKSSLLAIYLQNLGVRPDSLVGICTERSLDMIVGLLGILKAGGAYVPLDPDYPSDRLGYMINDSGALIVLTQSGLMEKVSQLIGDNVRAILLDSDWDGIATVGAKHKKLKREVCLHQQFPLTQ